MERTIQKSIPVSDGSWVSVEVFGDPAAADLMIVPGVMSDAHTWRHVARAVTAWPSVLVVNRRGRQPSGPLGDDYSLRAEVEDLREVVGALGEPRTLFGWSYGGLIALLFARDAEVGHLIAYEPVDPLFGNAALPALREAHAQGDWDRAVEIVNEDVSGFPPSHVASLRADPRGWATLRRLSEPLYPELSALAGAELGPDAGRGARSIDVIVGGDNAGRDPYGTSVERVMRALGRGRTHLLPGQGHLAHLDDPAGLARLLDHLAR